MKPELEDRALSIVVQLAESPAENRDELRSQLCGDDAELKSAVADLWQAHERAERKEFWQPPAHAMLGPSESPAAAPAEEHRAHPASTEDTLVADPNAAASEATLDQPPPGSGGAQPVGDAQDSASGSANSRSSKRAGKRAAESVSPPPHAPTGSRFIPKDLLGKGGQAEVWFALDPELGRHVALKVVKPNLRGSEPIIAGFNRESEITGKLEHPNIVPVYEAGLKLDLVGQPDESGPFYTMRAYGDRRWLKALEAFHARPRPVGDRALIEATKAFHDDRSERNRRDLEEQWRKFNFDSQHAGDRDLKEAVRGLLDEVGDSLAGSLQQAIDQFHAGDWSEPKLRDLLERFVDVCNALAYAHDRGVIHRDLKPLNVMLGEFGETLVADWGLAKIVGRDDAHRADSIERTLQAEQDSGASHVGQVKGTLVYMSPEQASGYVDTLGPASDIYSLGAILFCLLTGQAPVTARPKSPEQLQRKPSAAGSVEAAEIPPAAPAPAPRLTFSEILTRVRDNEFPRPKLIDPRVPKALEAIVLKAMSKKPRERYAMAKLLADDVKRWLNDEPVTAWPEPFTIRAKRWAKNHQTAVTSTAAAILMAMLTLSVMFAEIAKSLERERDLKTLAQKNERRAITGEKDAKTQRDGATVARNQAEANEQRAIAGETLAKSNADTATRQRNTAQRLATDICLQNGYTEIRHLHNVDIGTLWYAQALQIVGDASPEARYSAKSLLGGWSPSMPRQLFLCNDEICAASLSPDGQILAIGSMDNTARLWDVQTGQPLCEPLKHDKPVVSVVFDPTGRLLATRSSNFVRFWDADTGEARSKPLKHDDDVVALAFSRDGTTLATASSNGFLNRGEARLWDVDTGELRGKPLETEPHVEFISFGPNNRALTTVAFDLKSKRGELRQL